MKEPKICPLLAAGPIENNTNCKEERCVFWNGGWSNGILVHQCAVVTIADALNDISQKEVPGNE